MAWFDTYEDNLDEDLGLAPTRGNQAVVQAPVAPIFQAPVAPAAPQGGVASLLGNAPKPTNASVPAFSPLLDVTAPNQGQEEALRQQAAGGELTPQKIEELMRQAQAPTSPAFAAPAPYSAAPAPHPYDALMNQVFGQDQTSLDDIINLTGKPPAQSPVAAPAPTAQVPAAAPAGHWETMGGGEGSGQSVWVEDKQKPTDPTLQYYQPFSGTLPSALTKYMPKSGSDLYGSWHFDTPESRQVVTTVHPETGETSSGTVGMMDSSPRYTTDENGNPTGLNPEYGLKDTTGLVHGAQAVPIDKTHIKYTYSFFDPQTGKPVGNTVTQIVENKESWSDKLAGIGMALASAAVTGGTLGGQLFNVAKAAGTGNLLGAATGALGIAGGAGDVLGADVAGAAKTAKDVIGAGAALKSGDPLRILGAAAQATGNEDLGTLSKVANTAAIVNKAAQGDVGAALNLLNMVGPTAFNQLTGGAPDTGDKAAASSGSAAATSGLSDEEVLKALDLAAGKTEEQGDPFQDLLKSLTKSTQTGAGDEAEEGEEDEEDTGGETSAAKSSGSTTEQGANLIADLQKAGFTEQESGEDGEDTGAAKSSGNQTGNLEEDYKVTDKGDIVSSSGETGDFDPTTGEFQPYGSGLGKDLGTADQIIEGEGQKTDLDDLLDEINAGGSLAGGSDTTQSDEDILDSLLNSGYGNLDEDFVVTDKGTIKSTYSGEEGAFDENGNFVPLYTPPTQTTGTSGTTGKSGTPGTPKTTTPKTPSTAQSGMDLMSLLALGMMGGDQQQAPQQQLVNLAGLRSVEDIFGLREPTSLAELLQRRRA